MITIAELINMPEEDRAKMQKGLLRELVIGAWAPREPQMMRLLLNTLGPKKLFSQKTLLRVIDRLIGLSIYTQVAAYEEMTAFIASIPDDFTIVRGPCACRKNTLAEAGSDARDIAAGRLDLCRPSPLNLDIQFGVCGDKFRDCEGYEPVSKKDLLALEQETRNMGLVSNLYLMLGGEGSICHCSSVTCVPLIVYNNLNDSRARVIKKGQTIAATDPDACDNAGACAGVCHFGARTMVAAGGKTKLRYEPAQCYGCGLCAFVCPNRAITMTTRNKARDLSYAGSSSHAGG
jgi:NAD-dependent dihydropyrimidine dehydrogenase PreA subunit